MLFYSYPYSYSPIPSSREKPSGIKQVGFNRRSWAWMEQLTTLYTLTSTTYKPGEWLMRGYNCHISMNAFNPPMLPKDIIMITIARYRIGDLTLNVASTLG